MSNPLDESAPDDETVLEALDDEDCRRLLAALAEPRSVAELTETCSIPSSTAYRKVELLSSAGLVEERVAIDDDGHHATEYVRAVEEVTVAVDEDGLDVSLAARERSPERRLEELWTEVRKQT